jgi:excisionase family DNA binding protein
MRGPAATPSLDQLADDPARAHALPLEIVMALSLRCATVQLTLAVRLTQALLVSRPGEPNGAPQDDRLLTPQEVSAILNVPVRWLYRHAGRLPFTRRLGRKRLRFSEAGLRRHLATRSPM